MEAIVTWIGPALDAAAVVLLGLVLWRLGREPGAAWHEREERLQAIFTDLRALVAEAKSDPNVWLTEEQLMARLALGRRGRE